MKNSLTYLMLLFCCISFATKAQNTPDLTALIKAAIANDGQLKVQQLENKVTLINNDRLDDVFLPKVALSGQTGYLNTAINYKMPSLNIPAIPALGFNGIMLPERTNNLNISGVSVAAKAQASLLIYSGGTVNYLKVANNEKASAEAVLMEHTTDEIITTIAKAYDQFALLNATQTVLDAAKQRLEINKTTADKALGYGLITPYDHQKIELAQSILETKVAEYHGKKELLITQLHILTKIERERIAQIQADLKPIVYLAQASQLNQRAEIRALNHGIKAADNKLKAEARWWVPKVMAKTSLAYMGLFEGHVGTSKEVIYGTQPKLDWHPSRLHFAPVFQVGIGFKWEVLDGREGKNATAEAAINKEILEHKKQEAYKQLQLNLAHNETQYSLANTQIKLKTKSVEIAKKALVNVEKEFRYGTKTSSDLIEAENDLVNAELEYQTAIFKQRRNAIELMKSTQDLQINKL